MDALHMCLHSVQVSEKVALCAFVFSVTAAKKSPVILEPIRRKRRALFCNHIEAGERDV